MMNRSWRAVFGACGLVMIFAANSFANVEVTVPEPASMTLLAVSGAGMYLLNRRRR